MTFKIGQAVIHKAKGTRMLFLGAAPGVGQAEVVIVGHDHSQRMPLDSLEAAPEDSAPAIYDFDEHIRPRVNALIPWAHVEPTELLMAVNSFAASSMKSAHGHFQRPGSTHRTWAHYFLTQGQGGGYTGEALAFVYGNGGYWDREDRTKWVGTPPQAFRVAICKHQKAEGLGADHRRGWHPGRCSLCGLDMTVDSGD